MHVHFKKHETAVHSFHLLSGKIIYPEDSTISVVLFRKLCRCWENWVLCSIIKFVSKYLVFSLQLSRKDEGVYKATLSDDRGHDVSSLELSGKGNIHSTVIE